MSQFQPHQDMINSLEVFERNERLLIVSASSDCSVALWDIYGNKIGVFGQVVYILQVQLFLLLLLLVLVLLLYSLTKETQISERTGA